MIIDKISKLFIRLPLKKVRGKAYVNLDSTQRDARDAFKSKLDNGFYTTEDNLCLCGEVENLTLVDEDKFGLPFESKLCPKCSLARTSPVLDEESLVKFYSGEFSRLHRGNTHVESFFSKQYVRGTWIRDLLSNQIDLENEVSNVLEIGCASGGNLYPFHEMKKSTKGHDYDEKFIAAGNKKGLNLEHGDYYSAVGKNSYDLVLLVHVLEHLRDPFGEILKIISKVRLSKYLYVEVPSITYMDDSHFSPLEFFQNDHIYHFNRRYLEHFLLPQ